MCTPTPPHPLSNRNRVRDTAVPTRPPDAREVRVARHDGGVLDVLCIAVVRVRLLLVLAGGADAGGVEPRHPVHGHSGLAAVTGHADLLTPIGTPTG